MGTGHTVVADNVVHDITVYGYNESVFYKSGEPFVWDRGRELGMTNRISQGWGDAAGAAQHHWLISTSGRGRGCGTVRDSGVRHGRLRTEEQQHGSVYSRARLPRSTNSARRPRRARCAQFDIGNTINYGAHHWAPQPLSIAVTGNH